MESEDLHRTPSHRGRRRLLIALGAVLLLVVVFRLVLDPVAAWGTRRALANIEGFEGTFSDVHVSVLPPSYSIENFKIIETPKGRWDEPLLYVEHARASVLWRKLLHGQLVARAVVERPKFVAARRHEEKAKKTGSLSEQLEDAAPLKVDRFEVVDGEVLIAEGGGKNAPKMWLNKLDLTAVNLATRKAMMQGDPASVRLRGRVQRSGLLSMDASLDPYAAKPTFTADAKLEKLDARELYAFLEKEAQLHAEKGVVNVYAELNAKNGVLKGGVKPILENIEVGTSSKDLGKRLKAFLADTAVEMFTDDVPGRDAVATVIPIRGTVGGPDVQLLPTVLGAVRNAFVVGLRSGFENLPPPTAEKKEGVVSQVVQALKKDQGPPEAQPSDKDVQENKDKKNQQAEQGKDDKRQGRKPGKPEHKARK
jgi:hypothetical protein